MSSCSLMKIENNLKNLNIEHNKIFDKKRQREDEIMEEMQFEKKEKEREIERERESIKNMIKNKKAQNLELHKKTERLKNLHSIMYL